LAVEIKGKIDILQERLYLCSVTEDSMDFPYDQFKKLGFKIFDGRNDDMFRSRNRVVGYWRCGKFYGGFFCFKH